MASTSHGNVLGKSIKQVLHMLGNGTLSQSELINQCYARISKIKSLNAFIATLQKDTSAPGNHNSQSLQGIPFSIKDNFNTKNIATTCGSVMLKDYVPTYNATVVDKLHNTGAVLVGKTNMDEFAMGSVNVDSLYGPVRNPWNFDFSDDNFTNWHVPGGSSGGSAVAVAAGASYFALGSDTGGSVRLPASFCGVVGLKPTYGTISRHGLISLVNSTDVPGIFTRTIEDCALVYNSLCGMDERDPTTVDRKRNPIEINEDEPVDRLVIGIPKEYHVPGLASDVLQAWNDAAEKLQKAGAVIKQVSLPHTQFGTVCYRVLSCCEIASNFARYDGVKYGHRSTGSYTEELYARTRNEGFNDTVRERTMVGNYFLLRKNYNTYYDKALRVRRLITRDFKDVFNQGIDVLLSPTTISTAPLFDEFTTESGTMRSNQYDLCLHPSSLSGVPAVSVPVALSSGERLPIGLQLTGNYFREDLLLKVGRFLESSFNFPRLDLDL